MMKLYIFLLACLCAGVICKSIDKENDNLKSQLKELLRILESDQLGMKENREKAAHEDIDKKLSETLRDLEDLKEALAKNAKDDGIAWTKELSARIKDKAVKKALEDLEQKKDSYDDYSGSGSDYGDNGGGDNGGGDNGGSDNGGNGGGDNGGGDNGDNGGGDNGGGDNGDNGGGDNGGGDNGDNGGGDNGGGGGGTGSVCTNAGSRDIKGSCEFNNLDNCGKTDGSGKTAEQKANSPNLLEQLRRLVNSLSDTKENRDAQSKVLHGTAAEYAQFPFVVSLLFNSDKDGHKDGQKDGTKDPDCGGSLLNQDWVLTAAHCLEGITHVSQVNVRIGDLITSDSGEQEHKDHPIESFIIHPKYDDDDEDTLNDIALIKLSEPAALVKTHVNAICLSDQEFPIGTECIVAGWGDKEDGADKGSDHLHWAKIKLKDQDKCGDLEDTQICASGDINHGNSVADSCQGDSGGPLFCRDGNGLFVQTGIVSYGGKCGAPNAPGVYTNVHMYICWINYIINKCDNSQTNQ